MKAILYKNGIEQRRVKDYQLIDINMGLVDFSIKGQPNPDNWEWKLLVEGVKPTITNLERLQRSEVDNDTSNATYPIFKQIDIVYTKERKPDAEITSLIENAESNANEFLISYVDRLKVMVLYMAIVHRKVQGLNISAKMQAILDKGDTYALKLWQNDTNLKNKLQKLADGQDPDINTGWTNE